MSLNDILIDEGIFNWNIIDEGSRHLSFNPPLVIEWSAYRQIESNDVIVFVDYDFGLTDKFKPYKSIEGGWAYAGLNKETPLIDIVKTFIQYDLFHAFCHTSLDPNYSHLHWALFGNLNHQTVVVEDE